VIINVHPHNSTYIGTFFPYKYLSVINALTKI